MTLYELEQKQIRINELLEENGGELTPELEAELQIQDFEINEKFESYCKAIKSYEAAISGFKTEIERLKARKETAEKAITHMKDAMLNAISVFGLTKVHAGIFTIGTRKSQSLDVLDESLIPDMYKNKVTTIKVDKNAIKDAIKNGEDVEGVFLNDNTNIVIK